MAAGSGVRSYEAEGSGRPARAGAEDSLPALMELEDRAEDRHFWFRGRQRVIATVAGQLVAGLAPGYRVIEVGAGNGGVLRALREVCRDGRVVGMDVSLEGLRRARRRAAGCPLICGDLRQSPLARTFHLVGLFDVLEHIADDAGALAAIYALLEPGGALLLTVPAHPSLWSYADEAASHYRRYTPGDLNARLVEAGFRVEYLSPFMATIHPLLWMQRRWSGFRARLFGAGRSPADQLRQAAAELRIVPGLNEVLTAGLYAEARLIGRRRRLPLGTSLIAIARKPAAREGDASRSAAAAAAAGDDAAPARGGQETAS